MIKLGRPSGVVLATIALLLSGCSEDRVESSNDPDTGGSCTFTVEFDGRTYTAAGGAGDDARRGQEKLGTAAPTPCSDDADSSGGDVLTIYTVAGVPVTEAVFATPDVGLLVATPPDQDE